MSTNLRKKAKNQFKKIFFKLKNNKIFEKLGKMCESMEIACEKA